MISLTCNIQLLQTIFEFKEERRIEPLLTKKQALIRSNANARRKKILLEPNSLQLLN